MPKGEKTNQGKQKLEPGLKGKHKKGELRKSKRRLKVLSDASFEAIFLSEGGFCTDQNLTAEKLFGYTFQEAQGRHGSEWIIPEDRALVSNNMRSDYAAPYEVRALRKDGTTFPCEIQSRNMQYHGKTIRVIALRDISERRQAEKDKENLRAKLANSIEMAQLGSWEYDVIKDIFFFNDAFYKIFRTTAEQVGGYEMTSAEYAQRFVHPDDRAVVSEEVRKSIETRDPQYSRQLEHRMQYADGTFGYILVRIFIQKDPDGKTVRAYGVNQDITERKQHEQTLRQLNLMLKQRSELAESRARQLQALAVELIDAEEQERRRIAQFLHDDLQQTIAAARYQLQAIDADLPYGPVLEGVARLLEESIHKSRRLSHELSPPILNHANLSAPLEWLSRQMLESFGLRVDLETLGEQPVENPTLKRFIYRAVQELLFNVVKHAGVKSARIELSSIDEQLSIAVSDSGRGFNPDILEGASGKGGFGLLTIRERANFIGGSLNVQSTVGEGSRFTLNFPFGLAEDELLSLRKRTAQEPPAWSAPVMHESAEGCARVLFADDHHVMRQGLIRLISGQPGIQVVGEAANGREAVEKSRQLRPDIIVMDAAMPVMDGMEATRRIKAEQPHVRVIGLSMYEDEDIVRGMQAAGADIFLKKTASPAELLKAIYGKP